MAKRSTEIFNQRNLLLLTSSAVLFLSVIINPETWWARYIPQFWIIPILLILVMYKEKTYNWIINIILVILIINSSLSAYVTLDTLSYRQTEFDNVIQQLEQSEGEEVDVDFGKFRSLRAVFMQNNIDYNEVNDLSACSNILVVSSSELQVCSNK